MPPAERTPSAYVQEVRQKLDASEDPQLLRRVGSRLGWSSYRLDPKQQALAQRFLERALELDPKLRSARAEPFRIRLAERHRRIHEARTAGRPVDEADRLAYEASRSAGAYMGGETLEYYKKDVAGARVKFEEASKQAQETLRLAEERPQDPSYSSSVATTRFVLAAVAMREGNRTGRSAISWKRRRFRRPKRLPTCLWSSGSNR